MEVMDVVLVVGWIDCACVRIAGMADALQAQSGLTGARVPSRWIRDELSHFCRALGATRPPAFKDFARELGRLVPKERHESWRNGKRVRTYTAYHILESAALAGTARAAAHAEWRGRLLRD